MTMNYIILSFSRTLTCIYFVELLLAADCVTDISRYIYCCVYVINNNDIITSTFHHRIKLSGCVETRTQCLWYTENIIKKKYVNNLCMVSGKHLYANVYTVYNIQHIQQRWLHIVIT